MLLLLRLIDFFLDKQVSLISWCKVFEDKFPSKSKNSGERTNSVSVFKPNTISSHVKSQSNYKLKSSRSKRTRIEIEYGANVNVYRVENDYSSL